MIKSMRPLASAGSDLRAIPIWVPTPYRQDDVIWGIRLEGSDNLAIIRDVPLYAEDISYGDIVEIEKDRNKIIYKKHCEISDWSSFVAISKDKISAAEIGSFLISFEGGEGLAARFSIPANNPILGISVKSTYKKNIEDLLELWDQNGLITEYTEMTQR